MNSKPGTWVKGQQQMAGEMSETEGSTCTASVASCKIVQHGQETHHNHPSELLEADGGMTVQ